MPFNEYDPVCIEGMKYTIELNTSTVFNNAVYLGTKKVNGKTIMIYEVKGKRQLGINPSYHTYTLENGNEFTDEELTEAYKEDNIVNPNNETTQITQKET